MSSSLGCWRAGCLVAVTWLSLVALTTGQGPHPMLVQVADFNITTTNIKPAGDPIILDYYVDLDDSLTLNSPPTRLKVRITVPYEIFNTSTGCKTYVSGYACKSTVYPNTSLVDFASFQQNLVLQPSPAVIFEKIENTTTDTYIEFDFGEVRINESVVDNLKSILFRLNTTLSYYAETTARTSFNFQGDVMQKAGPGQQMFTNTSTVSFTLDRPVVTSSYSASPAELSAGINSTVSITIQHDPTSTAAASSFTVAMSMLSSVATYGNDASWSINGGGVTSVSSLSDVLGGASSTFNLGDVITITCTMTAPAIPELEASGGVSLTITYSGLDYMGSPTTFNYVKYVAVDTPSVTFTGSVTDSDLGSTIPAGSTITLQRTIELPVGVLKGFSAGAYFETNDANVNLATTLFFASSTLPAYDAQLTFSDPANINVGTSGISITTNKRRKRATTTSLTANRYVGDITNPGPGTASLTLQVLLTVHPVAVGGILTTADTYLTLNGNNVYLTSYSPSSIARPLLSLSKTAQVADASTTPDIMQFSLVATHDFNSNADAYDVKLYGGNNYFDVYWTTDYSGPTLSTLTITNNREFRWDETSLAQANTMYMTYKADAATNGDLLTTLTNPVWINATLEYKSAASSATTYYSTGGCCLTVTDIGSTSLVADHGFTVMSLLFGILLGFLIILLVMFILVKVCRKAPFNCECSCCPGTCHTCGDTEIESQTHSLAMGGGLVLNSKAAVNKGFYRAKDVVKSLQVSIGESIVGILRSSDKFKMHRELDNRDIESTIYVDTQIEEERDGAMAEATVNLLKGLQANGDIPSDVMDKCLKKFRKGIVDLDKDNENNFRNELGAIYDGLSKKNKEKLADLLASQQDEEEDTREQTTNMSPKERDEILKLMRTKHETQKNELTYILKLEQDEESEKLRKEFMIRKRMGLKDLQQDTLDQVKKDAKLTDQQADWLMKEYLKNQAAVEKLYDDEISRQRMVLEEKLARRRALAAQAEAQEEHQTEMLNTLATQQMQTINKMKKENVLSPDEAQALIDETHAEMIAAKKKMDMERSHQEDDLQQKLSDRKRKRLENLAKKHEKEKTEMEKKHKSMQTERYVEPLDLLEEQQNLVSIQRQEIASIDNEMDEEHAKELLNLRDESAVATKEELEKSKDNLFTKLKHDGMSEDQADKILSKHKKDMAKLEQTQQDDKERQEEDFKKTLAKRKREWASRREEEKKEQEQLREHEDQVVRKLMDNQVAISEDERDRIMKEHEKQMVKLDNSLTLNKLQQKRMLEERLAKKRSQQMEKLQKKQQQESKKANKQLDNDSDMDDDERHQQELEIMKKHAEQRIAVLQGEKIELDDEIDAVRDEMLKERASALKDQEVQLGAMLAALQMEKAKEMSRIEEQQKAIHDLKANLMDDLNEKGILSDPKCQQVIEMHRKEQEKLQNTLDNQRAKQEKALRKRLQDRLKQKEANLMAMQDQQIKDAGAQGISPAARIRRAALKAKHLTEMEEFRNRMEKEINQTLEDVRRQNDMRRIQDLQEQELQFINGLVRLGSFKMEELEDVLVMLFPLKTDEQRKEMLATLTEGFKPRQDKDDYDENDGPANDGTLIERVKSARFERAKSASQRSARGARNNKPVNKKKGRKNENRSKRFEKRPEPLGQSNSPDYYSDEDYSVNYRSKSLSAKEKLKRKGR